MWKLLRLLRHMLFGVLFGLVLHSFLMARLDGGPPFVEMTLFAVLGAIGGLAIELGRSTES
jgi:hypothetical protein